MLKMTKNICEATALTHSGRFHADDVISAVILNKVYGDITLLRTTRVPEKLTSNVVVFDIGGGEYDHHQKGGNGMRNNGIPYAAAGLIWRRYGHILLKNTADPIYLWNGIDKLLIQGIDAIDNGVMPQVDYEAQPMSLSQAIAGFNPQWDTDKDIDNCFLQAADFAARVFDNTLSELSSKLRAREIIETSIEAAEGGIMVLPRFVPWQNYVFESINPKAGKIKFVVFPSNRIGYNWQCVPDKPGGFGQRKSVPKEWYGLKDEDIQRVSGVKTATFCHANGFIGGAMTLEDAISMAKKAMETK